MTLKLTKYQNAGVREYWMVDLEKRKVITWQFTKNDIDIGVHGFTEQIPLYINGGECRVDFTAIQELLEEWGESGSD